MYCNNCGTQISENSKFCLNCGSSLETQQPLPQAPQPEIEETVTETVAEEPVANQTAEIEQPSSEKNVQQSAPKKWKRVLKNIVSVLCCILIFAVTLSLAAVLSFRTSIAPDKVSYILDNLDIKQIVEYEEVEEALLVPLDGEEAEEIYEKSTIKEFVEEKANEFADYILYGTGSIRITGDDFVELVEENEELIEEISGEPIFAYDYDKIEEFGENLEEDDVISEVADVVKTYCSVIVVVGLILVALILCALLYFIRKSYDALLWTGSAFSLTALLLVAAGLILKPIISVALAEGGLFVSMIGSLYVKGMLTSVLTYGGCLFGIGVVLILAYLIIKAIKKMRG